MPDSLLEKTCYEPSDYQDVYLVKRHFERKKETKIQTEAPQQWQHGGRRW